MECNALKTSDFFITLDSCPNLRFLLSCRFFTLRMQFKVRKFLYVCCQLKTFIQPFQSNVIYYYNFLKLIVYFVHKKMISKNYLFWPKDIFRKNVHQLEIYFLFIFFTVRNGSLGAIVYFILLDAYGWFLQCAGWWRKP